MSIEQYSKRVQKWTLDGSPIFTTVEDIDKERWVADICESKWECTLNHLGIYSSVDYWAVRKGQPVGWVEIKSRYYKNPGEDYPTALLNVRKWLALSLLNMTTEWPAILVSAIEKADGTQIVRHIPVAEIDASPKNWRIIKPRSGVVKSRNDIEPCITIPYASMKVLYESGNKQEYKEELSNT